MKHIQILLSVVPMFWPKHPPLGIGYLQAYLLHQGYSSDILDLNNFFYNLADPNLKRDWLISANTFLEKEIISLVQNQHPKDFEDMIKKMLTYDVIGFSCFKSNLNNTLALIQMLKERKPELKIVLGGPEMARQHFKTEGIFTPQINTLADHIVVGEGEESLYQFILNFLNDLPQEKYALFSQFKDLSQLPYPRFSGVDFSHYPRKNAVPIEFSRGCVRRCNFCSERLLFQGYRTRSVQGILEEIENYRRERNIQYFIFFDSMLNGNLPMFEKLLDGIIERFGAIQWEAQMAVRKDMDFRIMQKMKQSGCYNIFIGLESGSDRTLQKMHKGFTSREALDFFKKLHQARIHFGVSMMVGYPGETHEDFEESLNFILDHKEWIPKVEQVNPFTYYEGTTADREGDYRLHQTSLERMHHFVEAITLGKIRYTKAFIGNLIEKAYHDDVLAH